MIQRSIGVRETANDTALAHSTITEHHDLIQRWLGCSGRSVRHGVEVEVLLLVVVVVVVFCVPAALMAARGALACKYSTVLVRKNKLRSTSERVNGNIFTAGNEKTRRPRLTATL